VAVGECVREIMTPAFLEVLQPAALEESGADFKDTWRVWAATTVPFFFLKEGTVISWW
jgi:hypothetical protein